VKPTTDDNPAFDAGSPYLSYPGAYTSIMACKAGLTRMPTWPGAAGVPSEPASRDQRRGGGQGGVPAHGLGPLPAAPAPEPGLPRRCLAARRDHRARLPRQPAHRLPLPAAAAGRHATRRHHPVITKDRSGHKLATAPGRGPRPLPAATARQPELPLRPARPPGRARHQLRQDDDQAHRAARLAGWLERVEADDQPELHTFATGIRQDLAAVTAGLTLPYSSGTTEGNVNRLKAIKRQMYGRASFDLLRKRVIHHPP
jgi:hypothetical protein